MCALIPEFDARKDGNEPKNKDPMKLGMVPGQSLSRSGAVTGASARNFLSTYPSQPCFFASIGPRVFKQRMASRSNSRRVLAGKNG